MEGVVINTMSKAKKTKSVSNLQAHNAQISKATGNRDDDYKKYNFDVLEMQEEKSVDNYNKYFKEHMHVGYNAHKEELAENDFVVPRFNNDISKVESIIVSPPVKVLLKDIDKFDFTEAQCFFDDYIHDFIKHDSKFKDVKILSAKVHCNEVYYPRFEEIENGDGITKLKRLSKQESIDKAYIKVHMHMDYIPLVEAEKNGIKYLKLSSNDIWKAEKGRYFDSFREFNDRFFESVGKKYGLDRGQKWEEWDIRVQKKNNGELVKQNTRLADWQLDKDEELNSRYKKQLEQEAKTAGAETKKKIQEEINMLEAQSFDEFERSQQEYANQLKQIEKQKKLAASELEEKQEELKSIQKQVDTEYDDYLEMHIQTQEAIKKAMEDYEKMISEYGEDKVSLLSIEKQLKKKKMTLQEARKTIDELGLDNMLKLFKDESAKEYTPNLYNLANNHDER